jgi:lysine 6-dehydrogenase
MAHTSPPYDYLILGAGRQGTAAAYDLACFGDPGRVVMADMDAAQAERSASRVNQLVGREIATGQQLDVADVPALKTAMQSFDVALSAVPYRFNLTITQAAIEARTSLCDMGGNTGIVMAQLDLHGQALQAAVSVVPDCGMGPGLINTMAAYAIEQLDKAEEIYIYDAGLPQQPVPPWNYAMTFHINGLTNEMDGQAVFIRNGKVCRVDTLSERETLDFPPLGLLEADITSGGTSTAPWTFEGKLDKYENKVLRYPGHFEWLKAFKTLGLFSEMPIQVGEQEVIPRPVYHALLEPQISASQIEDVCVIRVIGKGWKDGSRRTVTIDLIDYSDPVTGFTAMERLTGWHCAITMAFQARGEIAAGVVPLEIALPAGRVMEEIRRRNISYTVRWD